MPDLMSGQLASQGVAFPPGVQPTVADVVVVVDRADVVARVAAAVPPGMVDGVEPRVGPERVAVGCRFGQSGLADPVWVAAGEGPAAVVTHSCTAPGIYQLTSRLSCVFARILRSFMHTLLSWQLKKPQTGTSEHELKERACHIAS